MKQPFSKYANKANDTMNPDSLLQPYSRPYAITKANKVTTINLKVPIKLSNKSPPNSLILSLSDFCKRILSFITRIKAPIATGNIKDQKLTALFKYSKVFIRASLLVEITTRIVNDVTRMNS